MLFRSIRQVCAAAISINGHVECALIIGMLKHISCDNSRARTTARPLTRECLLMELVMRRLKIQAWAAVLPVLLTTACGAPDEPQNISEDQMNHFAGIMEHDHPSDAATNQAQGSVTMTSPKKPVKGR